MPEEKAGRPLGSTGEAVRQNIKRLRGRMPVTELSAKLEALGRPIPPLGVRRIEDGTRRVDADDLATFAVALGVTPITLLMPESDEPETPVTVTGYGEAVQAERVWNWLRGDDAPPGEPSVTELRPESAEFWRRAWPKWLQGLWWAQTLRAVASRLPVPGQASGVPDGDD